MGARVEIRMPADQAEGTRSQVLRWLHATGDAVRENEPLIEIETDKVTVEVAAPASGVLSRIAKQEQEEVAPGEVLGEIDTSGSQGRAAVESAPAAATSSASTARADAGAKLSPAVRKLLAEHGLDASAVQGTGQDGRITAADVEAHVSRVRAAAPSPAGRKAESSADTATRRVPHSVMRKRIAAHMVESARTAPHVTSVFEVDLSAVLAHRARHREEFERHGTPLTLTAYLVAACVPAIRAVPEVNSRWTDEALEIFDAIHVGVAAALGDQGLIVPVLRNVQSLDLRGIARGLGDLVSRARAGKLTPADVQGGTFSISNHGVSGSLMAAPVIINQPQSAILGVGKVTKRPVVEEVAGADQIRVRPMCYVTLSIDHRVVDGFQANRFLTVFTETLRDWPSS